MAEKDIDVPTEVIAETEGPQFYQAWKALEPDGETTYHLELNNITIHFFDEEWDEFLKLAHKLIAEPAKGPKPRSSHKG
jgi:hypothetical protein